MSPRFEYQNQDEPHDDEEQEEDAFPSTNVLLVSVTIDTFSK